MSCCQHDEFKVCWTHFKAHYRRIRTDNNSYKANVRQKWSYANGRLVRRILKPNSPVSVPMRSILWTWNVKSPCRQVHVEENSFLHAFALKLRRHIDYAKPSSGRNHTLHKIIGFASNNSSCCNAQMSNSSKRMARMVDCFDTKHILDCSC